jgi:aminoglycoside phosphotransferase (APT) family kinase protein
MTATPPEPQAWLAALVRAGLVAPGENATVTPLAGGVSSDIVRVDAGGRTFCVKRALAKLKVAADWRAPVERNHAEAEWIRVVGDVDADAVPAILAEDVSQGLFAMSWLPPDAFPVWKNELRDGRIDPEFAAEVGRRIARVHAATAGRDDIAARFANDHIFYPIRLEAYLVATAERHPDLRDRLLALVDVTRSTKRALVHGDVSPKNILVGPRGPVFLDAECAWYGDPAFDLAFCLNHMLLKAAWRPQWPDRYLDCFDALADAYLGGVTWEPAAEIEIRAARLLPGLFLARVDGKSPVEYITDEVWREHVRRVARPLIAVPVERLRDVGEAWRGVTG